MKKIIALCISAVIVCLLFAGCELFSDASVNYSETAVVDGLTIEINRKADKCFAAMYTCDEYEENMEITIPDSYDGVPLTQIGGYVGSGAPSPFCIELGGEYSYIASGSDYLYMYDGEDINCWNDEGSVEFDGEYHIEEVVFTLKLGKNISEIEKVDTGFYYTQLNEDGSITVYHPVVSIVCDEANEYFYSEDGKLYSRETNELIKGFSYASDSE